MGRYVLRGAAGAIVAFVALYLADWAVWRTRVTLGGGMGKATVSRMQVAPLKGNKLEYYYDGTTEVDCSRSIFPQAPGGACWWVLRHPVVFYQ